MVNNKMLQCQQHLLMHFVSSQIFLMIGFNRYFLHQGRVICWHYVVIYYPFPINSQAKYNGCKTF